MRQPLILIAFPLRSTTRIKAPRRATWSPGSGAGEPGDQGARRGAFILVVDRKGNAIKIKGCRIAKDDELDQGRADQNDTAFRILQNRQQLLDDQGKNATPHAVQSKRLRVISHAPPRKITAMIVKAAKFGRSTAQTLPARKIVCRIATK